MSYKCNGSIKKLKNTWILLLLLCISICVFGAIIYQLFSKDYRVKKYVRNNCDVNAKIISKETTNKNIVYILKNYEDNSNIVCRVSKEDFQLDNTKFFSYTSYHCDCKKKSINNYNSKEDFYKKNDINKIMINEVMEYINEKYSITSTLDNISVSSPIYDSNSTTYKEVIITLIDKSKQKKLEVTIDKQKYNNDLSKGNLSEINSYVNDELNIVLDNKS